MNEVIIRILDNTNNVLGDLDLENFDDFPLVITKGIVNLDNLKARTGTFTKNFKVPNTKNNSVLLSNVDDINSRKDFRDALNRKPCSIMVNGNEIEKGFVQVSKSYNGFDVDSFELVFFGNNIDWVKQAAEFKLNTLTFADNAQVYNVAGINSANASSFPTKDHCYPYISRGGILSGNNDSVVEEYYPCFYLSALLQKGLNSLGYEVSSSFINDSNIKKLACDLNGDMRVSQTTIDNSKTRASKTSDQTVNATGSGVITFDDDSTVPNEDNNNNYNTSTYDYTVPTTGRYTFTVSLIIGDYTLLGGLTSFPLDVKIMRNNFFEEARVTQTINTQLGQQTKEYTLTALLNAGEEIRVYYEWSRPLSVGFDIKTGSYFKVQRSSELKEGDNFALNEVIPDDIKLLDVINDFTRMFNIYYWTDIKTKKIYFEPRDTFFKDSTTALDWSDKIDLSNNYEIDYVSSYKRDIKFSYKEDGNDEWLKGWEDTNKRKYAEYTYNLPDRFGEGTTEVKLDLFSASYAHICNEATPLNSNAFTSLKYWNEYINDPNSVPTDKISSYNSRIFNFRKNSQLEPNGDNRKYSLNGVSSPSIPYGIFESYNNTTADINLSFTGSNGLFNTYYSNMLKNIEEGGRLIAYFNLTSIDFDNLDFRKLVYIDAPIQAKGYYLIESVNDYNPINNGLTKVSLFKYENLGSVDTDLTQEGNNDSDDDNADVNVLEPIFIESGSNLIEVWSEVEGSRGTRYEQVFKD
jgi:hypothetical protein|tara:strand:+ start:2685 stop:4922 length:2238 start_codon:yes stop_codon:yes gene_type:complete